MVAAGVPALGLRGGWRDCCIVIAPERSGSGDVRCSTAVGCGRCVRRRGGMFDVARVEADSVTGVSLARWLRRGRSTRQGVSWPRQRVRGWLVVAGCCPSTPRCEAQGSGGGSGGPGGRVCLSTPPRAEWLALRSWDRCEDRERPAHPPPLRSTGGGWAGRDRRLGERLAGGV